jgi:hypothetical protein
VSIFSLERKSVLVVFGGCEDVIGNEETLGGCSGFGRAILRDCENKSFSLGFAKSSMGAFFQVKFS